MENFNMNKRSQDLLAKVGVRTSLKSSVTGISLDSRRVEPGTFSSQYRAATSYIIFVRHVNEEQR